MSAVARSQIRPPDTAADARSTPVPVVAHEPFIVSPSVITTRVVPFVLTTPIQADDCRSIASPDRSPSAIAE